jgi:hypothetical protein
VNLGEREDEVRGALQMVMGRIIAGLGAILWLPWKHENSLQGFEWIVLS